MKRDSYSDPQAHASFQPRSPFGAIDPTQLSQPVHHSSSTSDLGAKWLNKASSWVADKLQTAQNFMHSGDAISPDQLLPALKGTATSQSQTDPTHQPLVGVIDSGFGANEHGSKMIEAIQHEHPQAKLWQGDGVGTGGGLDSLVEFVDVAKATGQSRAVVNLSFDLTEVRPDGSTSTRTQLTAEEQAALAYARDNGVLVVASSGNQGGAMSALGQASQPSDNLIVVGAANGSDRASYSSYGNGLDLVADVGTAGTSLAAAKVTGAIANIWSANPGLNSQQVEQMLTTTATDLKAPGRDAETGAGLLNATGAIDLATHTTPESIVFSGAQLMQQVPEPLGGATWESRNGAVASERSTGLGNWLKNNAHSVLDVAGFVPVVGAVADVANAGLYAAEGDYTNAALSAAAAVPGIGDAAAAAKLANRGARAVQAANRGARATEKATSAARAIPSRPRVSHPPAPKPASPSRSTRPSGGSPLSPKGSGHSAAPKPTSSSRAIRPSGGSPLSPKGSGHSAAPKPASPSKSTRPSGGSSLSPKGSGHSAAPKPTSPSKSRRPESGTPAAPPGRRQPALDRGNTGGKPKSELKNSSHSSRGISGQRKPNTTRIGDEDVTRLTREFKEVGGNPNDFRIVQGGATHYDDATNKVNVGGNIFPNPYSGHPRSIMSTKATLAHELGHQAYRGTSMKPGDWRDEFRASYHAARHSPGLSDEEKLHLVEDAVMRAREEGATINANKNAFIARTRGVPHTPKVAYKSENS